MVQGCAPGSGDHDPAHEAKCSRHQSKAQQQAILRIPQPIVRAANIFFHSEALTIQLLSTDYIVGNVPPKARASLNNVSVGHDAEPVNTPVRPSGPALV